mgnify:FL=1
MKTLKQQNQELLNEDLLIHWWNFGKKTLDFEGTIKEYLDKNKVKLSFRYYQDETYNFERNIVTAKFSCGQFKDLKFVCHNLEDVIRMIINFCLSYMGDKAQFKFLQRTRTINF